MSSEWPKLTLKQAGISLIDCDHRTPAETKSGYPYVSIPQLRDGRIVIEDARRISTEDFLEWTRKAKPKANDVVLSRRCNPGESAYVADGVQFALGQNLVILRSDGIHVHPPFLRWLTRGSEWWRQVETYMNVGAVFTSLKCADIPKFELTIPSIDEQRRIADVLKALDDKIDLNRRINQTLEAMAQAIFKSWFVDFDPVKAKIAAIEQGQDPLRAAMCVISGKSDVELDQMSREEYDSLAATAALFPEEMQESELGEIPKGWEISDFGSVSVCFDKNRIPLSKRQRENKKGSIPYYGATSVMDYVDEAIFDGVFLLLGEDGSVLRKDGTPFVQYIWGKSWVNNHAHVLQGANGVSTEQLMLFISRENISAYVTGAVQLKLNQKNMNSIPFIKAEDAVSHRFSELINPLYEKHRSVVDESNSLVVLRDTLLPKLLSGELSVGNLTAESI